MVATTTVLYKVTTDHESLQKVLHKSTITKEIAEFLLQMETNKDPHFILIEGAPGMGKTLLLKEIAYGWGKGQILQKFKFIILYACMILQYSQHNHDQLLTFYSYFANGILSLLRLPLYVMTIC